MLATARRPLLSLSSPPSTLPYICLRCSSHHALRDRPIPPPTSFVPDTETFLTLIGRGLKAHSSKIPSWDSLFTMTSAQLREAGVEPARSRKYLLWWRERFRQGIYGIGGDLQEVHDGKGEIRVFEVPVPKEWLENGGGSAMMATATRTPGMRKVALNVRPGEETPLVPLEEAKPVGHVKVRGARTMAGSHIEIVKGSGGLAARIAVKEGLWEEKRGRKVDGGERRKAEVRAKRRAAERKAERA